MLAGCFAQYQNLAPTAASEYKDCAIVMVYVEYRAAVPTTTEPARDPTRSDHLAVNELVRRLVVLPVELLVSLPFSALD